MCAGAQQFAAGATALTGRGLSSNVAHRLASYRLSINCRDAEPRKRLTNMPRASESLSAAERRNSAVLSGRRPPLSGPLFLILGSYI